MSEITVGLMTIDDVDAVHEIESACFKTPWSKNSFIHEMTENQCARYVVVREDGRAIAYAGVWFILDEGHITNIAVAPANQGQGIGEALMQVMLAKAYELGSAKMTLEVRTDNLVAQNLYHKLGFTDGAIKKGYYIATHADAMDMTKPLD